jgi:hypothetical protein
MDSWQSNPKKYTRLQAIVAVILVILFPVVAAVYLITYSLFYIFDNSVKLFKRSLGYRYEAMVKWLHQPLFRVKSTQQEHDEQYER